MRKLIVVMAPLLLAGCASTMSGLDGESKFSCKAPEGVSCASLSGVYANAVANNLPSLRKDAPEGETEETKQAEASKGAVIVGSAPSSGDPIRTQPKVLRIWIAPWEDSEGDLHDQSYIYVVADPGRWAIEYNQKRIIDRYRPTFIKPAQANGQKQPSAPSQQTPQMGSGVVLPGAQGYAPVQQPQARQE